MQLLLLIWLFIAFPLGILIGRAMKHARESQEGAGNLLSPTQDAQKLAKEVMTEENKDQIAMRFTYFQNRRRHGADEQENYARLISELESFRPEESDD